MHGLAVSPNPSFTYFVRIRSIMKPVYVAYKII